MMHGRIAALALSLAMPVGALAAPNYDYIQADWIAAGELELDESSTDYDGYGAEASASIGDSAFLTARYDVVTTDEADIDIDRLSLGLGGHVGNGTTIDLYGVVSFERMEIDSSDGDGFGLTGGIRMTPAAWIEIDPHVGYVDYGEVDGDDVDGFRYGVRTTLNLTEQFGVSLTYRGVDFNLQTDDVSPDPDFDLSDELILGARFSF